MGYRHYPPPDPLLIGYDPCRDLPDDHLARFIESLVEEAIGAVAKPVGPGQPEYDPRLCVKVLIYGYATGVRSSRQLERLCRESLPYLFLTRGEAPSYGTLCSVRRRCADLIESVWISLFAVADEAGITRMGRLVVDSTKMRANAGPESVVKRDEFEAVKQELARILAEAELIDQREETEGAGDTQLSRIVEREQMRDILRRVRKRLRRGPPNEPPASGAIEGRQHSESEAVAAESESSEPTRMSGRMLSCIRRALKAIEAAQRDVVKHVCLTDPDARMMGEGRERKVRQCHSFEVAVDNGILVAGLSSQRGTDNARLEPLVETATRHEPCGVAAIDADSGYYAGDVVAQFIQAGIDVCIPDSNTACDLRRGQAVGMTRGHTQGSVPFIYDSATDIYTCPEGNRLRISQQRVKGGQFLRTYRAERECCKCPLATACLTQRNARRRTLKVGRHAGLLENARQRFSDPEHIARYHRRAQAVETVFGFLRGTLGYVRWTMRGSEGVAAEAQLFKMAYQVRKLHRACSVV